MEYISVKDAAKKWEISERYVQRCCVEGRIEGTVKLGGSWAIPANAEKPLDKRRTGKRREARQLRVAMPLMNTPYQLGAAMEAVEKMSDEDTRNIARAEYYYFSGQSEKASDIAEKYLTNQDLALRLSACWLYAYVNLSLDRIPRSRQALAQIQQTAGEIDENTPAVYRAYAACIATGAKMLLHLPLPESSSPIKEVISVLPTGLRLFALYVQAHHAYLEKQYGVCIGIAETALVLEDQLYPIPSIYLHLVATMGHINLRQPEQARAHLLEAWKIAQPDDMIEPFGEHHGLLGGVLESTLKRDYPKDFERIIEITYRFSSGWRKIHNPETGHDVADDLTTTEFVVAMLAARGWSNKEIANHLGVKTNTVKVQIGSVLQKLSASKRSDLAQFLLE